MKMLKKSPPKKAQDPGSKIITMTIAEKAEMIHGREMARQERNKAQTDLARSEHIRIGQQKIIQNERKWKEAYQEENGNLHRELLEKRFGSFLIGVGLGILLAIVIVYPY